MLLKIPLVWTSCGGCCGSAFAFAACITAASLKPSAISGAGGKAVPSLPPLFKLASTELNSVATSAVLAGFAAISSVLGSATGGGFTVD